MPIVENEFTIKVQDLDFTFYSDTLLIHNPNQHAIMISFCNDELSFNLEPIATIENVDEFVNSDDMYLVLKYGRKITNDYIFNSLKIDGNPPLDIKPDDIKEYLDLFPIGYSI